MFWCVCYKLFDTLETLKKHCQQKSFCKTWYDKNFATSDGESDEEVLLDEALEDDVVEEVCGSGDNDGFENFDLNVPLDDVTSPFDEHETEQEESMPLSSPTAQSDYNISDVPYYGSEAFFPEAFYKKPHQLLDFERSGFLKLGKNSSDNKTLVSNEALELLKQHGMEPNVAASPYYSILMMERYKETFGMTALFCEDWATFHVEVKQNSDHISRINRRGKFTPNELDIYSFGEQVGLSVVQGESLIELITKCMGRVVLSSSCETVPKSEDKDDTIDIGVKVTYDTLVRRAHTEAQKTFVWEEKVDWPASWNMQDWDKAALGPRPSNHALMGLDLMECVSHKLLSPEIMLGPYRGDIHLKPIQMFVGEERVTSHFMSG